MERFIPRDERAQVQKYYYSHKDRDVIAAFHHACRGMANERGLLQRRWVNFMPPHLSQTSQLQFAEHCYWCFRCVNLWRILSISFVKNSLTKKVLRSTMLNEKMWHCENPSDMAWLVVQMYTENRLGTTTSRQDGNEDI
jgi:hypothetical protein